MRKTLRRTALTSAALAVFAVGAGGCVDRTDDAEASGIDGAVTTSEARATPSTDGDGGCTSAQSGGAVTMGTFAPTSALDPLLSPGTGFNGASELTAIYDTLIRWNPATGIYEPHVAESFTSNADHTEWTVRLRAGVTFGNGDPLDAQAVIASIARMVDSPYVAGRLLPLVERMVPIDDLTVVFRLADPWANFPYLLSMEAGMIVNTEIVSRTDAAAFNLAPVGAGVGPYEVENFAPGEEVVMRAKDDYWGGPVCIETLRFISVRGGRATYDSFRNGEMQVALIRDPQVVAEATGQGVAGLHALTNGSTIMFINQGNPSAPRSAEDIGVRRAIAFATDVDLIDERVNRGTGLPTSALVHPESLLADGALGPSYDPDRASALVEEARQAGWDGRLDLLCFDDPVSVERCLTLEGLLEAAGMEIAVENVPVSVLVQRVVVDRDYDLACLGFAYDAEPWTALAQYESESLFSRTGYGNVAFDAALDRLRASETVEETRLALAEAQGVWNETTPSVVLAASDDFVALSDDIHGLRMTRDSVVMFDDAYFDG